MTLRRFAIWLPPLALYSAAALFITYPLVTQLSTHVIGSQFTDSYESVRTAWWQQYAVTHGLSPFYQSLFAYPSGFFSTLQWLQPLTFWPMSLLNFFFNPASAFNIWILIEIVLNGLAAYWLCLRLLTRDGETETFPSVLAALLGGLIFMIFPTAQGHLSVGHAHFLAVYGLPPLAWTLYAAATDRATRRTLILGALSICVLLLSNYAASVYLIFPLFLMFALWLLVPAILRRQALPWAVLRKWAIIAIGGIVLSLPSYLPLLIESFTTHGTDFFNSGEVVHYSTDLLAFATISPHTPWTAFTDNPTSRWIIDADGVEGAAYLGLAACALALVALFASRNEQRKQARLWVTVAAGSMILSLGPVLKWAGFPVQYYAADFSGTIAMPWALFQNLPTFNVARTPGRINFVTALSIAVLACLGLCYLLNRIKVRPMQIALTAVLMVFVMGEYQEFFPFPTLPAQLPKAFYDLADRTDVRAVLDVPLNSITGNKEALYEQTAHHKPLIAGYVVRGTPVSQDKLLLLSNVAMGSDYRLQDGQPLDPDTARAVLKANGVDVLVYHWKFVDKASVLRWATHAFNTPLYQDDETAIFDVPAPDHPAEASAITYDSMGWIAPPDNASKAPNDPGKAPWFGTNSSLIVYAPQAQDRHWALKLSPFLTARQVSLSLDGAYQGTFQLAFPTQTLDIWLRLSKGYHRLQFTFPQGCTPIPISPVCMAGTASGSDPECRLPQANGSTPVTASQEACVSAELTALDVADSGSMRYQDHPVALDQGLVLDGLRLPDFIAAGTSLTVETDWHTQQKLDGDYHYFVHVLAADGSVAGQYDGVPGAGQFPTAKWEIRQQWRELDSVPITGQAGKYSVYGGWYRYPDLTRLKVLDSSPQAANGLLYLGDFEIK